MRGNTCLQHNVNTIEYVFVNILKGLGCLSDARYKLESKINFHLDPKTPLCRMLRLPYAYNLNYITINGTLGKISANSQPACGYGILSLRLNFRSCETTFKLSLAKSQSSQRK